MKISQTRCDTCSLEIQYENTDKAIVKMFHEPIVIHEFSVGNTTHATLVGKHYCSIDCAFSALSEKVTGVPTWEDRVRAWVEANGFMLQRKEKLSAEAFLNE